MAATLSSLQRTTAASKSLYIVRHGQAQHNPRAEAAKAAGCSMQRFFELMRDDDALDADLTQIGREQGRSSRLSSHVAKSLDLVVSSPLSRALETANLVVDGASPQCSFQKVCCEDFREINGSLLNAQRRSTQELREKFPDWDFSGIPTTDTTWSTELETYEACADRGYLGLCWLMGRSEQNILLVAHGGLLRFMMTMQPNVQMRDMRKTTKTNPLCDDRFDNCEVRRYLLDWEDSCDVKSVDDEETGSQDLSKSSARTLVLT
eukprot:CAMPEP_0198120242 /NCGR_PEP_ID=MMETSP1442-20131203/28383_1 /TAXON_ID= /ORGANISM="Craspedostauros australis, Strain CCMP3328" /LENGTH=262 /DNA_ID=CAMNT_0043778857 /DNA_START=69 /DNA_END=854 /DNA_ORIENTATION=-